ncbi:MAG: Trk system potassium transporter TrkA [Clostridia bacterium]|nr:Trk system potassium transporter TrkA [Clostridia bacterium]
MRIVVVGNGKLGASIARKLADDGHEVVVVDHNEKALSTSLSNNNVSGVVGGGVDRAALAEAGVSDAQVVIAVTQSDEVNIITSILAKKMGAGHTIARIREPEYMGSMELIRPEMGLGMNVNPELEAAEEISRVFRFPSALQIEFFSRGRVEIVELCLKDDSPLVGMKLADFGAKFKSKVLICTVRRGEEVFIPTGDFVLQAGDNINITGALRDVNQFCKKLGYTSRKVKTVMIVGGGRIGYYLARILQDIGMEVKILEKDRERCEKLSDLLPKVTVIHCDGTEQDALMEEDIAETDGLAALTGLDEENVIISMFAQSCGVAKVVTKINHITFGGVLEKAGIDCVVTPHVITTQRIVRYVRALQNSEDSSFETLISLAGEGAEAIEFHVGKGFAGNHVPLKELKLKKNILIAVITRGSKTIHPTGDDCIMPGDNIVLVTTRKVNEISDILQ